MRRMSIPTLLLSTFLMAMPSFAQDAGCFPGQMANQSCEQSYLYNNQAQLAHNFQPDATQAAAAQQMSPYQLQEQALQQSQALQQMEELRRQREMEANVKYEEKNWDPQLQSGNKSKDKLKKLVGGLGAVINRSVQAAAPLAATGGAVVGSYFIMRATMPTGYMPMMTTGGPMMMPVYGQ